MKMAAGMRSTLAVATTLTMAAAATKVSFFFQIKT